MIRPAILREDDEYGLGAPARRKANPELQNLLAQYVEQAGLPRVQETPQVEWDPERCRAIAHEFESLDFRDDSEIVREAYRALADEISAQFDLLSRYYAIDFYGEGDPVPYRDSQEMMDDVLKNHHLAVFTGGSDHAFLSPDENVMFRAVHDLFGHAAHGNGFGPSGEENAWVQHSKAFTPLARAALTTETRGQNSWVNCGPHADLPAPERPYAEQKAALLPEDRWTHPVVEEAYQDIPEFLYI